jgi:phosphohistidine phosphatase
MKLILMRHTEAVWSFGLDDHARPLSPTGTDDAHKLGGWLLHHGHSPSLAVVSDALRTQETYLALSLSSPMELRAELYLATPQILLKQVHKSQTECLLVVAHNPGIAELAHDLAGHNLDESQFYEQPPGSTLVGNYDLKTGQMKVIDFITPIKL